MGEIDKKECMKCSRCKYAYDKGCIVKWLNKSSTCPNCRCNVNNDDYCSFDKCIKDNNYNYNYILKINEKTE